jgi:hypothetical protein
MKTRVVVEGKVVEEGEQVLEKWKESMEVVEVWELMMNLYYHRQNCFLNTERQRLGSYLNQTIQNSFRFEENKTRCLYETLTLWGGGELSPLLLRPLLVYCTSPG